MSSNNTNPQAIMRLSNQRREQRNRFAQGSVWGQITEVSASTDEVKILNVPVAATIRHPYMGVNSWDRAQPEVGSGVTSSYSKEFGLALMEGYIQVGAEDRISAFIKGSSLYRELAPGELERISSGMAYTFHAGRPIKESGAGLVRNIMDGDSQTDYTSAATHVRRLHLNKAGEIKDMDRFGVVRRPKSAATTQIVKSPLGELGFAKERTFILESSLGTLIDSREGHVVEEDGTHPISSMTGNFLRYRKKFFTKNIATYVNTEIDNLGNLLIELPLDAAVGAKVDIKGGRLVLNVGQDLLASITKEIAIHGYDKIVVDAVRDILIEAKGSSTATLHGFLTKLGKEANHPLVFGDTFMQHLMTFLAEAAAHAHPGAPPSPNMAAACVKLMTAIPSDVSMKVVTQ